MSRLLLTGYDAAFSPIGELTTPRMLQYASRHGMDFLCLRNFPSDAPAYWEKIPAILRAFDQGYREVLWLDADQVVTNFDFQPPAVLGFHASLDWGIDAADASFFSMCGFTATPETRFLFEWVRDNWLHYINNDFPEQTPMRFLYKESQRARNVMHISGRRVFNAVPEGLTGGVVEPWSPECFAAHLTHVSVEARVSAFYEVMNLL